MPLAVTTNCCIQRYALAIARLAQSAERKALNLVVVGSSPTVGAMCDRNCRPLSTPWSSYRIGCRRRMAGTQVLVSNDCCTNALRGQGAGPKYSLLRNNCLRLPEDLLIQSSGVFQNTRARCHRTARESSPPLRGQGRWPETVADSQSVLALSRGRESGEWTASKHARARSRTGPSAARTRSLAQNFRYRAAGD